MRKILKGLFVVLLIFTVFAPVLPVKLQGETSAQIIGSDGIKFENYTLKKRKNTTKNTKNNKKIAENSTKTAKMSSDSTKKLSDNLKDYYVIYDYDDAKKVVLVRGDEACEGDEYISADNKKYYICEIDKDAKTAKAKYVEDVKLPVVNVKRNDKKFTTIQDDKSKTVGAFNKSNVFAEGIKKVGIYHTHNDECYRDEDGEDSVYGKGGIHDIGKILMGNLEGLGINVAYSENLHLPHNSGAYSRSEVTASELLRSGDLDALFDVHRDATPRKEYLTTVNGEQMSKIRMVVGAANKNFAQNKEFALTIKAYADEVYPGLIKDIYIGKGNYNQQLFERAMLFEMGTNLIEKELVRKSTLPLAKTIDAVLYGVENASKKTTEDIEVVSSKNGAKTVSFTDKGLVAASKKSTATNGLLFWAIGISSGLSLIFGAVYAFVPKFRHRVNRFFSELIPVKKPKN